MPSPGKALMDIYDGFARDYSAEGLYEEAQIFSSAQGAVNNVMHGRSTEDIITLVRDILTSNRAHDFTTPAEAEAYATSLELLEEFAQAHTRTV
jgi:hypothetical protein